MFRNLPILAAAWFAFSGPSAACDVQLLLSWDVSASMSEHEFSIQRHGTADAFRNARVKNAIALSNGGVAVALSLWAGPEEQSLSLPWVLLQTGRDAEAFAAQVEQVTQPFGTRQGTAIGNSLQRAADYLALGPAGCARRVIDISGDGASNTGLHTARAADVLARANVTINGLVLPGKPREDGVDPYMFYVRNVARGHGSFVMDVGSYEDFPRAMQRKLLRELTMQFAWLSGK